MANGLRKKEKLKELPWADRKEAIMDEIKYTNPSILMLQEIESERSNELRADLKNWSMEMCYHYTERKQHGCAVAFKTDVFSKMRELKYTLFTEKDGENSAVLLHLQSSDKEVIVGTTHIACDSAKHIHLLMFLKKLKEFSKGEKNVIFGGDFNIDEGSLAHNLISGNPDKTKFESSMKSVINFASKHRSCYLEMLGKEPKFNGKSTLDYIVASKNLKIKSVLMPIPVENRPKFIPYKEGNKCIPSDHVSLAVNLE